ncbi:MAG: ATP-dependent helicase HrpB [Planctomycetes bacterium]|nr:ATP-dependent helicase HrpB [Planctomycetota bacterium]
MTPPALQPLPIDPLIPELVRTLQEHPALVLQAPPGAGKTTRFPRALLDAGFARGGEIWVLEPRRLAARLAARRAAFELGQPLGHHIGYSVRFESTGGPDTRLRFVTEGVLLRRLTRSPALAGIAAVVLDEFHERHLETDVALATLLALQRSSRPDLKLAVLSATLDTGPLASHLACPVVRARGRIFPVDIEYSAAGPRRALSDRLAEALPRLAVDWPRGDILIFLPGVGEILECQAACRAEADRLGIDLLRLHGSLDSEEQDAILKPGPKRRAILATNVAETSVTLEGVTAVIDSGLVKAAGHSPWSGLPTLSTTWTSQASADQRAGRAGRTAPGRCLRLYSRSDLQAMRPFTPPEILRADLSGLFLELKGSGISDPRTLPWLEPPPDEALHAAEMLLKRLVALDARGGLTPTGRAMLEFPAHPRLARILCEARARQVLPAGALLAAALEFPDPDPGRRWPGQRRLPVAVSSDHPSDPIRMAEELSGPRVRADIRARILRTAQGYAGTDRRRPALDQAPIADLLRILLCGFPDRAARRTEPGGFEFLLSSGGRATLAPESSVRLAEFLIALEAREDPRRRGKTTISRASAIEPDWLLDLPGNPAMASREHRWNPQRERVEARECLLYDQLVLEAQDGPADSCPEASQMLAREALKAGLSRFLDEQAVENLMGRLAFVASLQPDFPALGPHDLEGLLQEACAGKSSFKELEQLSVKSLARARLGLEKMKDLDRLAPEEMLLPSGRRLAVRYSRQGQPWAAATIQDFYGTRETPRIGAGRVPIQLHLLSPSRRPAQITTDLAGFWANSYDRVRKDLGRRYPKQDWPDDPARAPAAHLKRRARDA